MQLQIQTAAIANSFTPQIDANLLQQVGLGANTSSGLSSLSIQTLAAQLTQPYAAAAAAAAALAARGPNIITTNATSLPYSVPMPLNQQVIDSPLITASTRTKSETKDKLAKLSILGNFINIIVQRFSLNVLNQIF